MKISSDKWQVTSDQQPSVLHGRILTARHPSHATQQGMALVITLIMLSVTLIMAIAFLAITNRERVSVSIANDATIARMGSDTGLKAAQAQIVANLRATNSAMYMYGLLVSTNYINHAGFDKVMGATPYNINYRYPNGNLLALPDFLGVLTNLYLLPRAPVMISGSEPVGRYYLDLNRNGTFEDTGDSLQNAYSTQGTGPVINNFFNGIILTNSTIQQVGDPQWVGILSRPGTPHSPLNKFISRYAFIAMPVGEALDMNFIHNQARVATGDPFINYDSYFRNQGVGSWEINLAAFLADLNTNQWYLDGLAYQYLQPSLFSNKGNAFNDAYWFIYWRYNGSYNNLAPAWQPGNGLHSLVNAFTRDNIDHYSFGALQTTTTNIVQLTAQRSTLNWVGSDNTNRFVTLADLFNTNVTKLTPFTAHLNNASTTAAATGAQSIYDEYTFYRMLEQLGTDTLPGDAGKLNLNWQNAVMTYTNVPTPFGTYPILAGAEIVPGMETNLTAWLPLDFFTAAADQMLKVYTTNWFQRDPISYMATYYGVVYNGPNFDRYTGFGLTNVPVFGITNQVPAFGIRNIPVQINGVFTYSPAVNRILQLAANIYDAGTNDFYPHVYRPILHRDPARNIFISGYTLINRPVSGSGDVYFIGPKHTGPLDLSLLANGWDGANNYYGVPWIVGAKKSMPNFNEFYAFNTAEISRKLQVSRPSVVAWSGANKQLFTTNQLLIMSITNHIGYSFWNSYTADYPGTPVVYANDLVTMRLKYGSYTYNSGPVQNNQVFAPNTWFGSAWNSAQVPAQRQASGASFVVGNFDFPFVHEAALNLDVTGNPVGFRTESFVGTPATLPPFPDFEEDATNHFQAFILDNGHVLDYVQFYGPISVRGLGSDLKDPNDASGGPAYMWSTNATGANGVNGVNWGVQNQITVSQTGVNIPAGAWQDPPNMPPGLQGIKAAEAAMFKGFFLPFWSYGGKTYVNTNLIQQAPYTPIRTIVSPTLWIANDPLVHYLTTDLNQPVDELNNVTNGVAKSDDPAVPPVTVPNLGQLPNRYQPWGRNAQMNGVVGALHDSPHNASYNLAYRDPLVWGADNWDFPTNHYPNVGWLGRVHRGTPWQTVYLKATNLLDYADATQIQNPFVGRTTWSQWTGNFNSNDATNSRPIQDELLFDVFTTSPNANASRGTLSVNQTHLAAWSAVLSSVSVVSNVTVNPSYAVPPVQANVFIPPVGTDQANSPLYQMVNGPYGINTMRANLYPSTGFLRMGDILRVPALTEKSPFLNRQDAYSASDRVNNDISDEMYEMIPQQIMGLLRPTGLPRYVVYAYGQTLKPDPNGTYLGSGNFFNLVTNYQVSAESVTRSVLTVQPVITNSAVWATTNYIIKLENFDVLPPD